MKEGTQKTLRPPDWIMRPGVCYFYDTVCGWCNVARPEIDRLYQQTKDVVSFQILCTRTHSWGYTPIIDEDRLERIQKVDFELARKLHGKTPSDAYLKLIAKKGYCIKSHLSALACNVVDMMAPEKLFAYAHALQGAVYDKGMDPRYLKTVVQVASDLGLETNTFLKLIRDPHTHQTTLSKAKEANALLKKLGRRGVPTLVFFGQESVTILDPLAGEKSAAHVLKALETKSA